MQQIIKFFIRFQVGIVFIFLLIVALTFTVKAHKYHQDKFVTSTNAISAYFYNLKQSVTAYFNLKEENNILQTENASLKTKVYNTISSDKNIYEIDSIFSVKPVNVISNSYRKTSNYLLINKGINDSVTSNYGVALPNGILGIIEESNAHYSRVISILHTKLSINAKLKNSYHFGSLQWNGISPQYMQLKDIPRSAQIKVGDTIVTGGNSLIFPKDIIIGKIDKLILDTNKGYYNIDVKLFADMTNLNQAYVIIPKKINEAKSLIKE